MTAGAAAAPRAHLAAWLWLGPLAFAVHDGEEIATVVPWLRAHGDVLPAAVRPLAATLTTSQFATGVAVLLAGYVLAAAHGAASVRRGRRPIPFVVVTGAFAANGVTHVLQAAYVGGYVPGVVTAALVVLPYAWGALGALRRAGVVTAAGLRWAVAGGMVLQIPLSLLALWAATGR